LLAHWEEGATKPWLPELLGLEERERQRRSLERRLRTAKIGSIKPMRDFDWTWPRQPENLSHHAEEQGHTVKCTTASDMLADLAQQESSLSLARRLRRYVHPKLLCIDEVGYLSYDSRYADLLFEVVTRRYESGRAILLSTNKRAWSPWS